MLRSVESGESQIITRLGEEIEMIVDTATYRREHESATVSVKELLTGEPYWSDELELPQRRVDLRRDTGLERM